MELVGKLSWSMIGKVVPLGEIFSLWTSWFYSSSVLVAVRSLSCVWLFAAPYSAARQAFLSFTAPGVCSSSCPLRVKYKVVMLKFMLKNHLRFPLFGDSVVKASLWVIDQCGNSLPTESVLDSGIVWELAGRWAGALKPLEDGCGCSWGWTERKVGDGEQPYFELLFARTLNRQKFRSDLKSYCFCSSVIPVTLLNIRLLCSF